MRYSGIFLDKKSKGILFNKYIVPEGWKVFGDHMTIKLGGLPENLKSQIGKEFELTIDSIGVSDTNIAFGVKSNISKNKIPHITWAVDMSKGKPKDSNNIKKWRKITPFKVTGVLSEK